MKLGFVGLGKMGSGIARNLLRAGHEVTVYNRSRNKSELLIEDGAAIGDSPMTAAANAEVVFTMLSDDKAVESTVLGERGLATGLRKGCLHISLSTISVAMAKKLVEVHEERGQKYLSAPVFGRPDAAESKKLVVVAAGDPAVIEKARPLLEGMGRAFFVAGDEPWQANLFKLCGNFMLVSMMETMGEAFAAVRKAGADHGTFFEIISEVFGSPIYKNYGSNIVAEKFEPAGFPLKLGLKDVRLALEAAQDLNVPMPIGSVVKDQLLAAMANGQEHLDWSSVAKIAAKNAGLT